jgi:ribosome-binding protein aMBF1 (putative translation factor)
MKERLAQQQHAMSMQSGERQFAWSAQQDERGRQMQHEAAERDFAQNMHRDERAHEMSQDALAAKMDGTAE